MAAISSFLIGGCLSIALAVPEFKEQRALPGSLAAWIVLGISFVAESVSGLQSMRQARAQAKEYEIRVWTYLRRASDPLVRAIVVEDSAALIGLCIAAGGLLLSKILETNLPDALASLLIGLLLTITAFGLARPLADFLVGRSLPAPLLEKLYVMIEEDPAVEEILSLRATYSGPEEVIVLGKVRPSLHLNTQQLLHAMNNLDRKILAALPIVAEVFIDVTG
jgi:divalent metal cation (Fe/Co/Zn/Cd) transporter